MIAYVDSSVVLRIALGQAGRLREWKAIERGIASALVELECLRTLDRMSFDGALSPDHIATRRETIYRIMEAVEVVEPTGVVLRRAALPLPTPPGTLDAIHLATALLWSELRGQSPVMLTHDRALATASRAFGLPVLGV